MQSRFQGRDTLPADYLGLGPALIERANGEIPNGPLGRPVRLGAHLIGDGADFAVRAANAQQVEVCIFTRNPETGALKESRYPLVCGFQGIWAGHVAGVKAGQLYGYRVHGKWDPSNGLFHNPAKVLLDPYARGIGQNPQLHQTLYGYQNYEDFNFQQQKSNLADHSGECGGELTFGTSQEQGNPENQETGERVTAGAYAPGDKDDNAPYTATESADIPENIGHGVPAGNNIPVGNTELVTPEQNVKETNILLQDTRDSAPYAALGTVLSEMPALNTFPRTPWQKTVIYEAHVVGLTRNFQALPKEIRGTYAGLGHPETIKYLQNLGITAIELLPIHAKFSEPFLARKNLENYWGYNTLSYFAPEPGYATLAAQEAGPQAVIDELKEAIQNLHHAGIEVLLDVVYNHTCEGGSDGPSISLRGLDNTAYYRHDSRQPGLLVDTTGCGNSLDFRHFQVIQLTLDSLRYWVEVIGVDGFRFDLAVTLGREGDYFNHRHPLYLAMAADPVLSAVKLINEPWDLGPNGWQTGKFPIPCADWNDYFRDAARSFWVCELGRITHGGAGNDMRDLATRLSGSADLFSHGLIPGGRGLYASINFVTAHDGFTMRDLVSYNHKHNEANLEDNRDGSDNNSSWNHGFEGGTDPKIEKNRRKSVRNLFGTLIFAAGTPMITAGDEVYKTQHGNNNAYCQNSELSYLAWDESEDARNMYATVSYLLRLRRENLTLRPKSFYTGEAGADTIRDLEWFDASGRRMTDAKWFDGHVRTIQMLRSGGGKNADALLILNGGLEEVQLCLPFGRGIDYRLVWDSSWEIPHENIAVYRAGAPTYIGGCSVQLYLAGPVQAD